MLLKLDKPRILIYDIETSPCKGWFWRTGKQVIGHNQILEPGKIICVAYRYTTWEEGRVESLMWSKAQSDKSLVTKFYKVAEKADVIIGHNGDGFDKKWMNARLAYHNHPTISHLDTEDTLKQTRKEFNLPSYRLDFLCRYFGIEGKLVTKEGMWSRVVFDNDRDSLDEMVSYCKNDVLILDKLYHRLWPYVQHKINMATYKGQDHVCRTCGSANIIKNGTRASGKTLYQNYFCNHHGGYAGKAPISRNGGIGRVG